MTEKTIFKAGTQSQSDPFTFTMSTSGRDRMNDVVVQDWKLSAFKKNPIALWAHDSGSPIGVWASVKVENGKLVGKLKLAERGTSELIDTLRSLIEQRILRAVSVGFRPGKMEPLDEKEPWGGYRLSKNELLECSLVSVPANSEAISFAKSLSPALRQQVFAQSGDLCDQSACAQLELGDDPPRDSGIPKTRNTSTNRTRNMSLSQKIERKQEQINALRNQVVEVEKEFDGENDITDDVTEQLDELTARLEKAESDLATMQKAEKAMAMRVAIQQETKEDDAHQVPRVSAKPNRAKGHKALATIAVMVKAFGEHASPLAIAKASYKDEPEIEMLVRAATDPATMTDAAWAAPLVRETWSEFLDLIRDMSVYPSLPGLRVDFDRYGKITVPRNNGRGKLAGGWVGELQPIPVKEGAYDTVDLAPKKMGVISPYSKEITMHSMPAIQGLVQNQMLEDTAEVLDTYYLDDQARTTTRPAGLQDVTETGADNINAATGATVAAILADLKGMISRLLAARAGNGAVWLINPLNVLSLQVLQDAASGEFVFKDEVTSGMLMGYPMLVSQNVPVDLLVLQGNNAMMFANDYAPMINVSSETTLVFDDTAPDNVLPDTNTQPAKSMFQVDGIAVKLTLGMDNRIVRTGGIQVLDTVEW